VFYSEGVVLNPSFLDYPMPCSLDLVPSTYADVITESFERDKHFHTKEVGEGYVSAMIAAIANAIYDATGARLNRTPISPERLLKALS
jgi:CO/xanthine dehydrogenase Mo-binding subunit